MTNVQDHYGQPDHRLVALQGLKKAPGQPDSVRVLVFIRRHLSGNLQHAQQCPSLLEDSSPCIRSRHSPFGRGNSHWVKGKHLRTSALRGRMPGGTAHALFCTG